MSKHSTLICSLFAFACAGFCQEKAAATIEPDILILTDGEKLVGHFEKSHGSTITFKSDILGEVNVDWSKVQELHSAAKFAVIGKGVVLGRRADTSGVPQGSLTKSGSNLTVESQGQAPKQIPVADAEHVVDIPAFERVTIHSPGITEGWDGEARMGAAIVQATQQSRVFTGGIALVRAVPTESWVAPRNRTLIDFSFSRGIIDQPNTPEIKTSILHGDVERDEYITGRLFGFGRVDFDHNYSQGLDLQTKIAGGLGYTAIKTSSTTLDFKVSATYVRQQFTSTPTEDLVGMSLFEGLAHTTKKGIIFAEHALYTPAFNVTRAWTGEVGGSMTVPVYKRFGFNVAFLDSFLNNPPPGFKKNSLQATMGLTYALKH
jgi:hypothetical protein